MIRDRANFYFFVFLLPQAPNNVDENSAINWVDGEATLQVFSPLMGIFFQIGYNGQEEYELETDR